MSPIERVLVAPAGGNVGEAVCSSLVASGISVRAGVLDPERYDGLADAVVRLDFEDPSTFGPALAGCDGWTAICNVDHRRGGTTRTTAIVDGIVGRPSRTMRESFEDHRERWEQEDGT